MEERTFEYKGYTFEPIGNLKGNWFEKTDQMTWAYKLEIEGYSHEDFYKVAKENHASCDVFKVNGKLYIPCNSCFAGILDNTYIKKCEEYERWYKTTKNEKLKKCYDTIYSIVHYHSKNLTWKQYHNLDEVLDYLKEIIK